MITALEEAMDYADGIKCMIDMTQMAYEATPGLSGVLYLIGKNMDTLIDLLAIVEAGEDMEEASADRESTAEASMIETNQNNSITYHEMMTRQFNESEGLQEPEPEPTDDSATYVKVDLKDIHSLRMKGKKAPEIADSYGVAVNTVYGWFSRIKKEHPAWVEQWTKSKGD